MICIENVFDDLVRQLNAELSTPGMVAHFRFGTLQAVMDELNGWTLENAPSAPVITLIEPFAQQKGFPRIEGRLKLRFLIATYATGASEAAERLESNFKNVLFPVYETFIRCIKHSEYFRTEEIKHTLLNHFGIGKDTLEGYSGTVVNNRVDALELRDFELDIKNKSCGIKNF